MGRSKIKGQMSVNQSLVSNVITMEKKTDYHLANDIRAMVNFSYTVQSLIGLSKRNWTENFIK